MRRFAVIIAAGLLTIAVSGNAAVRVIGQGETKNFDPSDFSPAMKANYKIMKEKCVRCHSLERVVEAITTGVSPLSGQPFDRAAVKAYSAKMLRKTNSKMTRQEILATEQLMNYLLDRAAH
jgi:hypothetical protein